MTSVIRAKRETVPQLPGESNGAYKRRLIPWYAAWEKKRQVEKAARKKKAKRDNAIEPREVVTAAPKPDLVSDAIRSRWLYGYGR